MKKLFIVALLVLVFSLPVQADRLDITGFEENCLLECKWNVVSTAGGATLTLETASPHSGTYFLQSANSGAGGRAYAIRAHPAITSGTLFPRTYFRWVNRPTGDAQVFWTGTAGSPNAAIVRLQGTTGGSAVLILENAVTSTTDVGTQVLTSGTWYRIELRHLLSDTVGEVESRLFLGDATTPLETLSITGEDTLPANISQFGLGSYAFTTGYEFEFDDFVVNDAIGSAPFNTWPGPSKTAFQEAASDNSITWERVPTNTTNWDRIDDLPGTPDDITTYAWEAVTLNSVDRLNAGALPAEVPSNATIISVNVYARVGSDAAVTASMRLKLWEEDATLTDGPSLNAGVSGWKILTTAEQLVFDASGKTKADVESFDYGYENITDAASNDRRITALWVNVEWLEAAGGVAVSGPIVITGPITVQ